MTTYYAKLGGTRILDASRVDKSLSDDGDVTNWPLADNFIVAVNINSGGKDTAAAQYQLNWRIAAGTFAAVGATGAIKFGVTDLTNGGTIAVGGRKCSSQGGDTWQNGWEVEGTALCPSINLPDEYENDNTHSAATLASGLISIQEHNFCNPASGSGYLNDQDWVRVNLKARRELVASAQPTSGDAAATLRLYAADGTTLLREVKPAQFGEITQLFWETNTDSTVYLQVTHLDGRVAGDEVTYKLMIRQGYHINMPLIIK